LTGRSTGRDRKDEEEEEEDRVLSPETGCPRLGVSSQESTVSCPKRILRNEVFDDAFDYKRYRKEEEGEGGSVSK
jgi:hypothetical protein